MNNRTRLDFSYVPIGRSCAVILLLLGVAVTLAAATMVYTFDGFTDSAVLTTQYPGLTFTNTIILAAGISLNEFEFPTHSGTNVASDNSGPITITFAVPVQSFGAYFTYSQSLTVRAFNSSNQQIASTTSKFSNNEALSGVSGSSPNELIQVSSAQGIASVTITGNAAGGSFAMDDVTTISSVSPCDVNGDGNTIVSDVQVIINEALGVATAVNDLNGDGAVNVADVQIVINAALGLGCSAKTSGALTAASPRRLRPPSRPIPGRAPAVASRGATVSTGSKLNFVPTALTYNVTDLGSLGGSSTVALGVNNLGQVVGTSATGQLGGPNAACGDHGCPISHAFLWDAGRMSDLGVSGEETP